ncbi:hypothetical protein PYCCODRAFT_487197 [Trametes coccinea BRFM310]|uniref:Uncharacterized protein n=1 Tax=Trametes coccinea (strain BRFM310) TaxID=1353009 RepID=A0A1Y2IKC6_TRAC3|nr:hypothetical protein PYCCODRAFT_487197 [Trametes coccinea BRFM310]
MMLIQCLGPRAPPRDAVSIVTAPRLPLGLGLSLPFSIVFCTLARCTLHVPHCKSQELVPGRTAGSSLSVLSPPLDFLL